MRYILIFILATIINYSSNAQSPFMKEARPTRKAANPFVRTTGPIQSDSIVNAWRFTASVPGYVYTFGKGGTSGTVLAAEYGFQHQRYSYVDSTLSVLWSINIAWVPINTSLPLTFANIQTFGITFGFKNPIPIGNSVIQVGPDYNPNAPAGQHFGAFATVGILLN
jgi:hypothetical protein